MARDFFQVQARGSSARTEVLGGLTTFTTMAYIIVVNPAILSFAGFPAGPSTVATMSHTDGRPRSATTMVGTVVTRSSPMMRGLVSAT